MLTTNRKNVVGDGISGKVIVQGFSIRWHTSMDARFQQRLRDRRNGQRGKNRKL